MRREEVPHSLNSLRRSGSGRTYPFQPNFTLFSYICTRKKKTPIKMFSKSVIKSSRVLARGFASSARAERKVAVLGAAGMSDLPLRSFAILMISILFPSNLCMDHQKQMLMRYRWYWSTHVIVAQDRPPRYWFIFVRCSRCSRYRCRYQPRQHQLCRQGFREG